MRGRGEDVSREVRVRNDAYSNERCGVTGLSPWSSLSIYRQQLAWTHPFRLRALLRPHPPRGLSHAARRRSPTRSYTSYLHPRYRRLILSVLVLPPPKEILTVDLYHLELSYRLLPEVTT